MKKTISKILVVGLALMLLVGCGGNKTAGEESIFKLTVGAGENTDSEFGHLWVNRGDLHKVVTFRNVFKTDNTLTEINPDLGESYEISEDGKTINIVMKDGLKWSDGEPLTAEDVQFSISTLLKAAMANGIYTTAFGKIKGAEAWIEGESDNLEGIKIDGKNIEIILDEPVGNFLNVLTQFAIYPKHKLIDEDPLEIHNSDFWKDPVTSGMYKVNEINSGNYIELAKNEHYEGQEPKIDKIVLTVADDLLVAAQSDNTYYLNTNAPSMISELNQLEGFTANGVDTLFYRYFVINYKDKDGNLNDKLEDPKVREAIMYAIDRDSLAESLYPELAVVNNTGVPESFAGYNSDTVKYTYDPEKAKALLKEANFNFDETLKLRYYYSDQNSIDFINAITQYLNDVGIKVDALQFQGDATTEMFSVKDHDLVLKGLSAFGFEEWYGEYLSNNANFVNIFGKDNGFDELVNKLVAESDQSKRESILNELQVLEQESLLKLPMFTLKNIVYVNENKVDIKGAKFGNPWYAYDLGFENWEVK